MDDRQWFDKLAAEAEARQEAQLCEARQDAMTRGKEAFDLDRLEALVDTTTDLGGLPPREERQRRWERLYYLSWPEVMTMAEFAERRREAR